MFGIELIPNEAQGGAQGVWLEHIPAFKAFLAVSTQFVWIAGAFGGIFTTGLDYARAKAGLKLAGIKMTPALWNQIRTIEAGAIKELNRAKK